MSIRRWKIKDLIADGAITAVQDGNHGEKHPTSGDYVESGIPFVMARDFKNGRLDLSGSCKIPKSLGDSLRIGFARTGDVLLTHKGTVGLVAIVPAVSDYVMLTPQVTYYRINEKKLHGEYLKYAFLSPFFQNQLGSCSAQSTRPYIGITAQKDLKVDIPDLPTQRKIAGILSAYDDLIENNLSRIKILEEMAQSLYREWFVHFRFPGHESAKFVDSSLGQIPKEWKVVPLEDVCTRITDGSHTSPKSIDSGGYPMASVKDMHDWGIDVANCRRIEPSDFEKLVRNDCKPLSNDILIAKDGSYLKHSFVVEVESEMVVLSSIAILRPNARIQPNLLNFILRDPQIKERMKGYVSGVAIPRIILKDFRKFEVMLPSEAIQSKWNSLVAPKVNLCRRLIEQNQNLRRTRDLLMPKLLTPSDRI